MQEKNTGLFIQFLPATSGSSDEPQRFIGGGDGNGTGGKSRHHITFILQKAAGDQGLGHLFGEAADDLRHGAGQDVHQNALLFTVSKVQDFFHSLYLKVVIVMSLLALAIYGLWWLLNVWHGRRPTKKIHRR